eukprot:4541235-Pyramimonas_sp.AAC.1
MHRAYTVRGVPAAPSGEPRRWGTLAQRVAPLALACHACRAVRDTLSACRALRGSGAAAATRGAR